MGREVHFSNLRRLGEDDDASAGDIEWTPGMREFFGVAVVSTCSVVVLSVVVVVSAVLLSQARNINSNVIITSPFVSVLIGLSINQPYHTANSISCSIGLLPTNRFVSCLFSNRIRVGTDRMPRACASCGA